MTFKTIASKIRTTREKKENWKRSAQHTNGAETGKKFRDSRGSRHTQWICRTSPITRDRQGMYLYRRVDVCYGFYVCIERRRKRSAAAEGTSGTHSIWVCAMCDVRPCVCLCACVDCPMSIRHLTHVTIDLCDCLRTAHTWAWERVRARVGVSHYMCCELDFRSCLEPKVNLFGVMDHKKPIFVFIYLLKFELFRSRWAIVGPCKKSTKICINFEFIAISFPSHGSFSGLMWGRECRRRRDRNRTTWANEIKIMRIKKYELNEKVFAPFFFCCWWILPTGRLIYVNFMPNAQSFRRCASNFFAASMLQCAAPNVPINSLADVKYAEK